MKACCICLDDMGQRQMITNICENHYIHKRCYIKYILFHYGREERISCPLCRDEIVYEDIIGTIAKLRKDVRHNRKQLRYEINRQKFDIVILKLRLMLGLMKPYSSSKINKFKLYDQNVKAMKQMELHYLQMQELECETERLWNYLNPSLFKI